MSEHGCGRDFAIELAGYFTKPSVKILACGRDGHLCPTHVAALEAELKLYRDLRDAVKERIDTEQEMEMGATVRPERLDELLDKWDKSYGKIDEALDAIEQREGG